MSPRPSPFNDRGIFNVVDINVDRVKPLHARPVDTIFWKSSKLRNFATLGTTTSRRDRVPSWPPCASSPAPLALNDLYPHRAPSLWSAVVPGLFSLDPTHQRKLCSASISNPNLVDHRPLAFFSIPGCCAATSVDVKTV